MLSHKDEMWYWSDQDQDAFTPYLLAHALDPGSRADFSDLDHPDLTAEAGRTDKGKADRAQQQLEANRGAFRQVRRDGMTPQRKGPGAHRSILVSERF